MDVREDLRVVSRALTRDTDFIRRDILGHFVQHADDIHTGASTQADKQQLHWTRSAHVVAMVRNVEPLRIFVEDSDLCVFSKLETKGDRIATIHTIFDTGPFATPAAEAAKDAAVDPLCHMAVSTATQSIARAWDDATCYF